jgi:hypothetical protein
MDARKNHSRKALKKNSKTTGAAMRMRRVIHVAKGFHDAREWEILQELSMTPAQRQRVAKALKERFYGKNPPDVRETHSNR